MDKKRNSGDWNSGHGNTGDRNSGHWNSGHGNTGHRNTGHGNTGHGNTGHRNSGDCNTGDRNSGDWNSGHGNSGDCNTGDWNSGDRNSGHWNSGHWNSGHWNSGHCNSITPDDCYIFNKPAKRKDWAEAVKPDWMFVGLTKWVSEKDMTDKEKEAYPSYVTTGGYLKCYPDLKAAFIDSWNSTTEEDRQLTKLLPNFDPDVFAEVFGFNPFEEEKNA